MGASHNIEYQISLKDILSGQIQKAEGNVNHFEGALQHTTDMTKQLTGAVAGFFGLYQGFEFLKSSVSGFNEGAKNLSQLRAALISTKGAAGITYEELIQQADKFRDTTIYDDDVIHDMQAQLLSFPEVTKEVFEQAEVAITDLATRTHKSLNETAVMVGKALSDPAKGIAALHRVGVEFSESQVLVIKKLVETGHAADAQRLILKELAREYGGSTAEASAEAAGQMEILKNQFEDVKKSLGGLIMEETVKQAPAIKKMIEDFRHLVEWLGKNKDMIISVTKTVAEITIGMWAFGKAKSAITGMIEVWSTLKGVVVATAEAISGATAAGVVTAEVSAASAVGGGIVAAEGIGAGIAAAIAANPVGLAIIATAATLVGIMGLVNYIANKNKETEEENQKYAEIEARNKLVKGGISDLNGLQMNDKYISDSQFFAKRQNELQGTQYEQTLEERMLAQGPDYQKMIMKHYKELYKDLVEATEIDPNLINKKSSDPLYNPLLEFFQKEEEKFKAQDAHKKAATQKVDQKLAATQSGVQGQSIKNTYITINGGLIHDFTIKTTTLKEATTDIKRVVTQTLTDAINDSEL